MDRLLKTDDPPMIRLYENQVKELQQKHMRLLEEARRVEGVDTTLDGAFGTVFDFLGNPYTYWKNGDLEEKRMVLRLVFAKKLAFNETEGFGTAATSLPFTVFSSLEAKKEAMVDRVGFEPTYARAGRFTVCCH